MITEIYKSNWKLKVDFLLMSVFLLFLLFIYLVRKSFEMFPILDPKATVMNLFQTTAIYILLTLRIVICVIWIINLIAQITKKQKVTHSNVIFLHSYAYAPIFYINNFLSLKTIRNI